MKLPFTFATREALLRANKIAGGCNAPSVGCVHILAALTEVDGRVTVESLAEHNLTTESVRSLVFPGAVPLTKVTRLELNGAAHKAVAIAEHERRDLGFDALYPVHLLLGVIGAVDYDTELAATLATLGVSVQKLRRTTLKSLASTLEL